MGFGGTTTCAVPEDWSSQRWNGDPSDIDPYQVHCVYKIGIYGWRKRCLYLLVMLLVAILIVNLALTIWIIRVTDFTVKGMGKLRVIPNGLRLDGEAEFMQSLYAKTIRSRKDQPLIFESSRNITLNARNDQDVVTNKLFLGGSMVEAMGDRFTVRGSSGELLFQATDKEVTVLAETLRITAPGGVLFRGSIQTPLVRAEPYQQLRLESPTRSMRITAPEGVSVESRAGDITASCLRDFKLESKEGTIWLDSEKVEFRNLRTALPTSRGRPYPGVYQLCACHNGRLFLAPPDGQCQADNHVCS